MLASKSRYGATSAQLDQIVAENLARYNVAPARLELELTDGPKDHYANQSSYNQV
jgi:hypothetical protein